MAPCLTLYPHSLRTHYLTHTFCFHFCAQTSRVSRRLGALCQATPSVQIAVNRAGRAWRALGKLPTQPEAALWLNPSNASSALLRWQSLARWFRHSRCQLEACVGRSAALLAARVTRPCSSGRTGKLPFCAPAAGRRRVSSAPLISPTGLLPCLVRPSAATAPLPA